MIVSSELEKLACFKYKSEVTKWGMMMSPTHAFDRHEIPHYYLKLSNLTRTTELRSSGYISRLKWKTEVKKK